MPTTTNTLQQPETSAWEERFAQAERLKGEAKREAFETLRNTYTHKGEPLSREAFRVIRNCMQVMQACKRLQRREAKLATLAGAQNTE